MLGKNTYKEKLLVKKLAKNNKKAFRKLFDLYHEAVFVYSFSFLKSKEGAEEVVQDVFLKIWEHRAKVDSNLSFKSFLFTITKNLTFNVLKKISNDKKLRAEFIYHSEKFIDTTNVKILNSEYETLKNTLIEQLPSKRKRIFKLSRIEGKSYAEISNELGISINTVKGQMSKSLSFIRHSLKVNENISF